MKTINYDQFMKLNDISFILAVQSTLNVENLKKLRSCVIVSCKDSRYLFNVDIITINQIKSVMEVLNKQYKLKSWYTNVYKYFNRLMELINSAIKK